jgi:5,10-methylene-tetrahydrofolate dehydrogenase/methenyl tetrahydrofolate cyclohydrolase
MIKPGATVIRGEPDRPAAKGGSRLVGDVDFANAQSVAGRILPTPASGR